MTNKKKISKQKRFAIFMSIIFFGQIYGQSPSECLLMIYQAFNGVVKTNPPSPDDDSFSSPSPPRALNFHTDDSPNSLRSILSQYDNCLKNYPEGNVSENSKSPILIAPDYNDFPTLCSVLSQIIKESEKPGKPYETDNLTKTIQRIRKFLRLNNEIKDFLSNILAMIRTFNGFDFNLIRTKLEELDLWNPETQEELNRIYSYSSFRSWLLKKLNEKYCEFKNEENKKLVNDIVARLSYYKHWSILILMLNESQEKFYANLGSHDLWLLMKIGKEKHLKPEDYPSIRQLFEKNDQQNFINKILRQIELYNMGQTFIRDLFEVLSISYVGCSSIDCNSYREELIKLEEVLKNAQKELQLWYLEKAKRMEFIKYFEGQESESPLLGQYRKRLVVVNKAIEALENSIEELTAKILTIQLGYGVCDLSKILVFSTLDASYDHEIRFGQRCVASNIPVVPECDHDEYKPVSHWNTWCTQKVGEHRDDFCLSCLSKQITLIRGFPQ